MVKFIASLLRSVACPAVVAAGGLLGATGALATPTGPLGEFNVLVFEGFSAGSSDVEGRLYAGGDVSLGNYSVGHELGSPLAGGTTLIVGGNLSFSSGAIYNGSAIVGGSAAGVDSSVRWGLHHAGYGYDVPDNVGIANLPFDFAAEQARLQASSLALAAMAVTGSSEYKWSQLFLTGDGTGGPQVFTVDAGDLGLATNIVIGGVADGVEVIINVSGASASMSGGMDPFFEANRENILFNFYEAEDLSLANIGVQGSILAPLAHIQTGWGVIWGQVVARGWNGPMQVNQVYYGGSLPSGFPPPVGDEVAVPAPAAAGLMLLGLIAMRRLRRRR